MELPPLTRGRERNKASFFRRFGITPAYAGKRSARRVAAEDRGNYPRLRGEEFLTRLQRRMLRELPPLTRGRAESSLPVASGVGITPAYAGKSLYTQWDRRELRNYPRLRGEEFTSRSRFVGDLELPPLTRGRECNQLHRRNLLGITPAYAGKRPSELERYT